MNIIITDVNKDNSDGQDYDQRLHSEGQDTTKDCILKAQIRTSDLICKAKTENKDSSLNAKARTKDLNSIAENMKGLWTEPCCHVSHHHEWDLSMVKDNIHDYQNPT